MTSDNLWGELLPSKMTLPVTILKSQVRNIGELTNYVLHATIDHGPNLREDSDGAIWQFGYDLDLVAPALNDYVYTVLRIRHNMESYPLLMSDCRDGLVDEYLVQNEEAFVKCLRALLSSEHVHRVINSLLAQSTDVS